MIGNVAITDLPQLMQEVGLRVAGAADRSREMGVHFPPSTISTASAASPPVVAAAVRSTTGAEAAVVGAGDGVPSLAATFVTLTAATLNTGCLDTGSQRVTVSSLAARGSCPSGSRALRR